jgi:hypothetical protein
VGQVQESKTARMYLAILNFLVSRGKDIFTLRSARTPKRKAQFQCPPLSLKPSPPQILPLAYWPVAPPSASLVPSIMISNTQIIPIRLEIDAEGYSLHETFTWHSPCDNLLLESQVESLCTDFDLPISIFKPLALRSIKEQILDFNAFWPSSVPVELLTLRILIKLDIIVEGVWLIDQLEWDPFSPRNSPEEFAQIYIKELKLNPEFASAIAHCIREQCFLFVKAMFSTGYTTTSEPDEHGVVSIKFNDPELAQLACTGPLGRVLRAPDVVSLFAPKPLHLTEEELDKLSYSRKRENRRKKRSTSVAAFTATSCPKTHRTSIGYRGSVHRQLLANGSAAEREYEDEPGERRTRPSGSSSRAFKGPSTASMGKKAAKLEAISIVCTQCSALVLPEAQGICPKCGNIAPDNESPANALGNANFKPNPNPTSTGAKRGRKPLSATQPTTTSNQSSSPGQPKVDPEPLPAHLAAQLPDWLQMARRRLDERYPLDLFTITWEDGEFKMKCIECSKTYAVGPHQSLSNFETHLKNRTHRGIVDRRLSE